MWHKNTTSRGSSPTIWWGKKFYNKNFYSSINCKIVRRVDGNSHRSRNRGCFASQNQLGPPNTLTKGCSILACKSFQFLEVLSPFWTTLLRSCDSSPTHNRHHHATSHPREDTGKYNPPRLVVGAMTTLTTTATIVVAFGIIGMLVQAWVGHFVTPLKSR